jgi:HEAT repeat protein
MSSNKKQNKKTVVLTNELARAATVAAVAVAAGPSGVTMPTVTLAPVTPTAQPDNVSLVGKLREPCADTAREAAIALGRAGNSSAVAALSEVVMNEKGFYHSVVRAAACASLGVIGDRAATPALIRGIADAMAEASAEAVRALALLRDVRAIDPLIEVVGNKMGYYLPVVRLAAVTALKQFGDPRAVAARQAVAANAAEDAVLRAAAAA